MAINAVQVSSIPTPDAGRQRRPDSANSISKARYSLALALTIVRRMETTSARAAVFEEIKRKNRLYRFVDALYSKSGSRLVQPLFLLAYVLKCALSISPLEQQAAELVSIAQFPNEKKAVERTVNLLPSVRTEELTFGLRNAFSSKQLATAFAFLGSVPRIWGFLRRLARTHSFMPAARTASALAFYIRFSQVFGQRPRLAAALIPSNYSPEAVGLAAAAHQHDRKVIYVNHAPVPLNAQFVAPVLTDCALFYGEMTAEAYKAKAQFQSDVALIGQPLAARPMTWRDSVQTIGIFLTAGTNLETLQSLVATIRLDLPDARVLIRQHPVTLLKMDFASLALEDENIELTLGNPLDEEIQACDLVICGNSGVALNVLGAGRPVAYLSSLDGLDFDYNGFVINRLVHSVPWWTNDIYDRLRSFYQMPGWRDVMQSYDAAYGADVKALRKEASETLLQHIRGKAKSQPEWQNSDANNTSSQRLRATN